MRAVIFGAGNIGRGFLGHLLGQAGYALTFVDVNEALINELNKRGAYPVRLVSAQGATDVQIGNVSALLSGDTDAVSDAIARADILATAVGARALPYVAPVLAQGLVKRLRSGAPAVNVLIAENLADANLVLDGLLRRHTPQELVTAYQRDVGLVETTIGRMVPVQTDAMRDNDPLRVCAESYGFFPVDSAAWKGQIANIPGLVPADPFTFYVRRKLFIHNMGHALCAYLGQHAGYAYIAEAIRDPAIALAVQNAMLESAQSLAAGYQEPIGPLLAHLDDLLLRFENTALGDTCQRVGADIERKLGNSDRLAGAMQYAQAQGIIPAFIALGAALAAVQLLKEQQQSVTAEGVAEVLATVSGLAVDNALVQLTLGYVPAIAQGAAPLELAGLARHARVLAAGAVV